MAADKKVVHEPTIIDSIQHSAFRDADAQYLQLVKSAPSGALLFILSTAIGMNIWMVNAFDQTRMAWYIVPVAMLTLWAVGQTAVAGPARKASFVSPAVATRAV